jgi:hydroxyacylglutathione hydrolase
MFLRQITDPALAQNAYLIGCQRSGEAIVIDPERDVDRYLQIAKENGFKITATADTHIHADYLSGSRELIEAHAAHGYMSQEGGADWQFEWAKNLENVTLLKDGYTFKVGNIVIKALLTPGHTPEHMSFLVTDQGGGADVPIALLSGDFLFVGDVGRPDLLESAAGQIGNMEPSARKLYASLRNTQELPGFIQILPAHGAGSACGKSLGAVPTSVLDYERRHNAAFSQALGGNETEFVKTILSGQPEPPLYFARMKRDNRQGPKLLNHGELPKPKRIHAEELDAWVSKPNHTILDLRKNREAFMQHHVKGSLFAPATGGYFSTVAGSYVNETDSILLLVEQENEIDPAVRELIRIGLDQVVAWMLVDDALACDSVTESIRRITTSELDQHLSKQPNAKILDVRSKVEFEAAHVKSASNIAHTRLAAPSSTIPEASSLFIHCGSGLRAAMASAFLAKQGHNVVYVDGAFSYIPKNILE